MARIRPDIPIDARSPLLTARTHLRAVQARLTIGISTTTHADAYRDSITAAIDALDDALTAIWDADPTPGEYTTAETALSRTRRKLIYSQIHVTVFDQPDTFRPIVDAALAVIEGAAVDDVADTTTPGQASGELNPVTESGEV